MKNSFSPIILSLLLSLITSSAFSQTKEMIQKKEIEASITENIRDNSNLLDKSQVFGEWIFNGNFSKNNLEGFNSDYKISMGDTISIKTWGIVQNSFKLTVDRKGNIFVPEIGPINVLGVKNSELNDVVSSSLKKIYKANVNFYVSLDTEQPVKVYVSGFARKPGLYSGLSSDSLFYYIDKAGGIDSQRGSYLNIRILRDNEIKEDIDLYEFIMQGKIKTVQFKDGDVIQILPRKNMFKATGSIKNAFEFEFTEKYISLSSVIYMISPESSSNKLSIQRKIDNEIKTYVYSINLKNFNINDLNNIVIYNNDELKFSIDKKDNTIDVSVKGEHDSYKDITVNNGTTLADLIKSLKLNDRTDLQGIQLFRKSIQDKQKESINESIRILETSVLLAESPTKNTAELRKAEADMLAKWIESARKIIPRGQVILGENPDLSKIYLEQGDQIQIPSKNWLVSISGQVLQPTSLVWNDSLTVQDYVNQAGGLLDNANQDKIIVKKMNGMIQFVKIKDKTKIQKGDEILIVPKIEVKSFQLAKDITEIIYQIVVSAGIVVKNFL